MRCFSTSTTGATGASATCTETFDDCDDGSVYELTCETSGPPFRCGCSRDGQPEESFSGSSSCDPEPAATRVNRLCGWDLR